jgi:hypothetical protein
LYAAAAAADHGRRYMLQDEEIIHYSYSTKILPAKKILKAEPK